MCGYVGGGSTVMHGAQDCRAKWEEAVFLQDGRKKLVQLETAVFVKFVATTIATVERLRRTSSATG
jgi:hypothetical protein